MTWKRLSWSIQWFKPATLLGLRCHTPSWQLSRDLGLQDLELWNALNLKDVCWHRKSLSDTNPRKVSYFRSSLSHLQSNYGVLVIYWNLSVIWKICQFRDHDLRDISWPECQDLRAWDTKHAGRPRHWMDFVSTVSDVPYKRSPTRMGPAHQFMLCASTFERTKLTLATSVYARIGDRLIVWEEVRRMKRELSLPMMQTWFR